MCFEKTGLACVAEKGHFLLYSIHLRGLTYDNQQDEKYRNYGAHRRGKDHDDRAHSFLYWKNPPHW